MERQAQLQERCAAQRARVASEVASIEGRFTGVDRWAGLAQSTLLHPAVITGGLVALLAIGRTRGLRLVGRLYLLTTTARRLIRTVRMFEVVGSRDNSTSEGRQL